MKGIAILAPSPVRLPQELKDWLKQRATFNRRSFNSEVIHRLDRTRQEDLVNQPTAIRKETNDQ